MDSAVVHFVCVGSAVVHSEAGGFEDAQAQAEAESECSDPVSVMDFEEAQAESSHTPHSDSQALGSQGVDIGTAEFQALDSEVAVELHIGTVGFGALDSEVLVGRFRLSETVELKAADSEAVVGH